MTHEQTCAKCGLAMPVPERYFGRELKCTKCGTAFTAGPAPLTAPPVDDATKSCPYCAETIKAAAVVCKHCGRDLVGGAAAQPKPSGDPDQLGIFLMMPWFAGAAVLYFWVWQSPRFLAASRFGMVALGTVAAAAILTAIDASMVRSATGQKVDNQSPGMWAIAVLLLAGIVAPLYAYKRGKVPGFSARYTALVLLGVLVFSGLGFLTAKALG